MRHIFGSCFVLALTMFAATDTVKAASIAGGWHGNGLVQLKSGQSERINCRIRYEESSGRTLVLYVTCAHAHGIFETSGRIVKLSNTQYKGRLYSKQFDVSGDVFISVSGNSQKVRAVSAKGSANVSLTRR